MFQQKKRKKICGSWRKEEEEESSESEEDMSSNVITQQEVSEQYSNLRRCSLSNVPAKEEEEDFRFLKEGGRRGEFWA